jgi:hypothetical protein
VLHLDPPAPVRGRHAAPARRRPVRGRLGKAALGALTITAVSSLLLVVPAVSGAPDPTQATLDEAASRRVANGGDDHGAPRRKASSSTSSTATAVPSTSSAAAAPSTSTATAPAPSAATAPAPSAATAPAPSAAAAPAVSATQASTSAGAECSAAGRTITKPVAAGTALSSQWEAADPGNDVTYDLSGVTSSAYPATKSPFAVGTGAPAQRTCLVGGTIRGNAIDSQPWHVYHEQYNAACVKIVALEWMQVRGLRCDNVEDGFRPQESGVNANNARFTISGTHLSKIRDDCLENDYTVGGLLQDNLWESCNTGISERPSRGRSWATPSSETLTLDRMLIGLYPTPHVEGGKTVMGENTLFKWSSSGNRLVIKCSIFKVNSVSLNGKSAMALPPGTVIDDSACPDNPSTIVWLGGGAYPASTGGMRVVSDPAVWNNAVSTWKSAHGMK